MAVFSKKILSSSTDGKAISVAAIASPGTTIHTGSNTSTTFQEVWIYAANYDTSVRTLNIEFGGTTTADRTTIFLDPYVGQTLIIPGFVLVGNSTPLVIRAFSDVANKIAIYGYVNEIS